MWDECCLLFTRLSHVTPRVPFASAPLAAASPSLPAPASHASAAPGRSVQDGGGVEAEREGKGKGRWVGIVGRVDAIVWLWREEVEVSMWIEEICGRTNH